MESKPKTGNISKRSNRKFTIKNDNFDHKGNAKKLHGKLTLKRRGLYVERNPEKLTIDEVFERGNSSKSSQRDYSSSILTSSIVGNRRSFIHEEIKTKRRVRKRNSVVQKAVAKCKVDSPKSRERTKAKVSKKDMKDDVVYVLQSNRKQDLTTSDSFRSKSLDSDSMISLKHDDTIYNNIQRCFESGIDRIAAQILQGWMTDKEKTQPENPNKSKGHNLSPNLTAAARSKASLGEFSSSKDVKPYGTDISSSVKKITFDVSDHTDINTTRVTSRKVRFPIPQHDRKLDKESFRKVLRVKAKTVRQKFDKFKPVHRTYNHADRTTRRNAKQFLGVIKRELEKCGRIPEEPRSMFDALKMVARNKHLSRRRISSHLSDTECEFQSSKLIYAKVNSSRLKSNSLEGPVDSQTKKKRRKKV